VGAHLIDGKFQSDKYPTCPAGKVPLSTSDPSAQDLLWTYAQRRRDVDTTFSDDLEKALILDGFRPPDSRRNAQPLNTERAVVQILRYRITKKRTEPRGKDTWGWVWVDSISAKTKDAMEHLQRLKQTLGVDNVRIKPEE